VDLIKELYEAKLAAEPLPSVAERHKKLAAFRKLITKADAAVEQIEAVMKALPALVSELDNDSRSTSKKTLSEMKSDLAGVEEAIHELNRAVTLAAENANDLDKESAKK
jgi:archaellum component FlaC